MENVPGIVGTADVVGLTQTAVAPLQFQGFITTTLSPAKGIYLVDIAYIITGTAETNMVNVQMVYNTSSLIVLPSVPTGLWFYQKLRLSLDGTSGIILRAANNAVGGSIYTGYIGYTRVGKFGHSPSGV